MRAKNTRSDIAYLPNTCKSQRNTIFEILNYTTNEH